MLSTRLVVTAVGSSVSRSPEQPFMVAFVVLHCLWNGLEGALGHCMYPHMGQCRLWFASEKAAPSLGLKLGGWLQYRGNTSYWVGTFHGNEAASVVVHGSLLLELCAKCAVRATFVGLLVLSHGCGFLSGVFK